MVLCNYFVNGHCRFGSKCMNDHIDLKAMLKTEIESAINGKQWLLSCFGPFKESTVIPNLMDRSFEEVRLDFLEASKNGTTQQHVNDLVAQYNDSMAKLNQLKMASPETIQLVANIYNQSVQEQAPPAATSNVFALANASVGSPQPQANPFQLNNVFGGSQAASSGMNSGKVYGISTNAQEMNAGSIFGSQPAASNNIFQSPTQSSIFGGAKEQQAPATSNFTFSLNQQAAKPSVFGSVQPTSPQTSIFGSAQPTQQQQPMGSSIFGGQPSSQFGSSSIFGSTIQPQQPQTTNSPFASSIFAQSQPAQGSGIFGAPQQPQQQSQMFAQPAAPPAPLFIQPEPQQTQPFGQPATGNPFGSFQPQPDAMQNVFGQASMVPAGNVFGIQQSTAPAQVPQMQTVAPQTGSIFQIQQPNANQQQPFGANPFQTQTTAIIDESVYSKMEDLTAEEIQAFQAPAFELGKIPLNPPPKQLCN